MNILKKRPLSLILCILLGGFSFFIKSNLTIRLSVIFTSLLIFLSTFIFKSLFKGRKTLIRVCLISVAISVILSGLWSLLFFPSLEPDTECEITGSVYEIDNSDATTSKITLKTKSINGRRSSHKIYVYMNKSLSTEVRRYDVINFRATLNSLKYEENSSVRNYYVADGISATAYDVEELNVVDNDIDYIDYFVKTTRLKICNTLKKRTNFETGSFLSALIMGDKSDLDGNTILNFKRIGISHILALSGMHLAILAGIITKVLSLLGISKKNRIICISLFVFVYMLLTGLSASVMRAGIMLIIAGVLYLLSSKPDNITSLMLSVSSIVLLSPHSIFDISLWLSAFATLGVIVFSDIRKARCKSDDNTTVIRKMALWIFDSVLVSVFATGATLSITALNFKQFSLLFAPATIILGFLAEFLIISGCIILAFGWMIPIGKPVIWLSDITKELAEWMSNWEMAQISTDSALSRALVVTFTIAFFAFLLLDIKKRNLAITILVSLLSITLLTSTLETGMARFDNSLSYAPSNAGDAFLLKCDGNITLIYSGSSKPDDARTIVSYLNDEKINYLDSLVLANYSYTTIDFCKNAANTVKIERIILPEPNTEEEVNQAEGLSDLLSLYGTDMVFYDLHETISFGGAEYILYDRNYYQYGDSQSNVFLIRDNRGEHVYLSSCDYDLLSFEAKALLFHSRNIYLGSIKNTKLYPFDLILPDVESINIADPTRLDTNAEAYYKEKGASINITKTPVNIWD